MNNAAYHGDLSRLKGLVSAGADPSKPDHDGRTALVSVKTYIVVTFKERKNSRFTKKKNISLLQHVAALRGYEDIVRFLVQRGANVNSIGMLEKCSLLS